MTDPKVRSAITGALKAFTQYGSFDAAALTEKFDTVFASDDDFMSKVD